MKLHGGIHFNGNGIQSSVNAMTLINKNANILNDNIVGYNKVGYQRKVPVISSFADVLGPHALSINKDEKVGRIKITKKPLDIALGNEGYFQVKTGNGIKLTRDGRFKLDKDGNLLTIENFKVLSKEGIPIKFKKVPKNIEDIKISSDGQVQYTDPQNLKVYDGGYISAVSSSGSQIRNPEMKQGYLEESNVALQQEVYNMIPLRRSFTVNTELFKIQNDALTKTLQELGKV